MSPAAVSLEQLLAAKEIVFTCGSGGVGKTTTAAALGTMAATHLGGKVLVLTVDPARRLADALGLAAIGNVETQIAPTMFTAAGVEPQGELWAAMLDTKQSWDDLVRRHAPDAATADKILDNALYTNITARFSHSHDYVAMERLYEIHAAGRYDLVIVDTPPSRSAIDFLDAPGRMADFFGSRLLRWLTVPYRSRVLNLASKPFYQLADRILGTQFLQDIGEFFSLLRTMEKGFVERSRAVAKVLGDRRTTFVVVTTLEASPVREAEYFINELGERKLHLGALVLNKVLPPSFTNPAAGKAADYLRKHASGPIARDLAPTTKAGPAQVARVLGEVAGSFHNFAVVAKREAEQRAELAVAPDVTVAVPYLDADVHDLVGLLDLGTRLWR